MDRNDVRLSRRLSYVLRHDPASAGLTLDPGGWVPVASLLRALGIDRSRLDEVVAGNDKQRFAIAVDGDGVERIRANQGHSVAVDLGLAPVEPPAVLYHGTSAASVDAILAEGLTRRARHHVHLSADMATARAVGSRRRGTLVVFEVDAGAMAAAGHVFHRSANGVWLTEAVPARFLRVLA